MKGIFYSVTTIVMILIIIGTSFFAGYKYGSKEVIISGDNIKTTGDTDLIKHGKVIYKKEKIEFDTKSTGEGGITTIITLSEVPEIHKWNNYNSIIKINMGYRYYGAEYIYRYDRYLVGLGVNSTPNLYISAGIMF
jgi:hypothetical protein